MRLTRRAFVQAAAAPLLVAPEQAPPQVELTVAHFVDRIRAAVAPWREKTIDGFKAGDPVGRTHGCRGDGCGAPGEPAPCRLRRLQSRHHAGTGLLRRQRRSRQSRFRRGVPGEEGLHRPGEARGVAILGSLERAAAGSAGRGNCRGAVLEGRPGQRQHLPDPRDLLVVADGPRDQATRTPRRHAHGRGSRACGCAPSW